MKRKPELSCLNVIFCFMVIWIHCCSHPVTVLDHSSWQYLMVFLSQRLAHVSVYGFFLLSGVKLMLPRHKDPTTLEYWRGRAKTLLIPYMIAVMVYYLWFVFCLHYFPFSWKKYFQYLILGNVASPFYFLIALFQFILLAPLIKYAVRRWSSGMLLVFSMGITWFSARHFAEVLAFIHPGTQFAFTDRVFLTYLFYFVAGCCIGQHYDKFLTQLHRSRALVVGAFVFFTICFSICACLWAAGLRQAPFLEELHFLYLTSSILFAYLVVIKIPWQIPKWLATIDRCTFNIYLYHGLFISFYENCIPPPLSFGKSQHPVPRPSFLCLYRLHADLRFMDETALRSSLSKIFKIKNRPACSAGRFCFRTALHPGGAGLFP